MTEPEPFAVAASFLAPFDAPERKPPLSTRSGARGAFVLGLLSVVLFGFILGPIALAMGRRVQLARLDDPTLEGGDLANLGVQLGKLGLAVHLCIALTAAPWALFMLPLMSAG